MKKLPVLLLLIALRAVSQQLPVIELPAFKKDTVHIASYGAVPDGLTLNSLAIQNAIDACSKKGGGTVLISKGLWLTGPLTLKSNVNLHLVKDAVLQFSPLPDDYPLVRTNWEGLEAIRAQSPLSAQQAENIAITGRGIIDGAGQAWRPVKKNKMTDAEWKELVKSGGFLNESKDTWYPTVRALKGSAEKRPGVIAEGYDFARAESIKEFLRPNMVMFNGCKKVLLEGVTFQNSPAWCIHPLLTQHLTLRNVTVRNPWNAQNGDGVDIESCRYVLVENCSFDVGDDAICIKSGRDEEGRKRGVPTEDVIVRQCTVFHGHGGFVVGSEMSGGARNLFVSDCNFLGTDIGLRFKTTRGRGGVVEKVYIDNIRMSSIGGAAILFDMYYMAKDPLTMFSGEEAPAIEFQPVTEATPQFKNISIKNVTCKGAETGVFVRGLPEMNIASIVMSDLSIESKSGVVCVEADQVSLKNATFRCKDKNIFQIQNSKNLTLDGIRFNEADLLLKVEGSRSRNIRVINTDVKKAKEVVKLGAQVPADAVVKY